MESIKKAIFETREMKEWEVLDDKFFMISCCVAAVPLCRLLLHTVKMKKILDPIIREGKRFVKYGVGGGVVGIGIGGGAGYIIMNQLGNNYEMEFHKKIEANVPEFAHPVVKFLVNRLISKLKNEGIESCAFYVGWIGVSCGFSLGFVRIAVGTTLNIVRHSRQLLSKTAK